MAMQIIINETGATETLTMINPDSGVDCVVDFIGNTGALANGEIVWDDDHGTYRCDQNTYDWWERVIAAHEAMEQRIDELEIEHGKDTVQKAIGNSAECDLEDVPTYVNRALNDAFGLPTLIRPMGKQGK